MPLISLRSKSNSKSVLSLNEGVNNCDPPTRNVSLPAKELFEHTPSRLWSGEHPTSSKYNTTDTAFSGFSAFSQPDSLEVVIVGTGFAGLSAAIACARQGFTVKILERSNGLSPHGDAITIGANAAKILNRWGLGDELWQRSSKGGYWMIKDEHGDEIYTEDLRGYPAKFGATILSGHRAQFLGSLGVEARMLGVQICLECDVVEYRDSAKRPAVVTQYGEVIEADVVLVADGVNTKSRDLLITNNSSSSKSLPFAHPGEFSIHRSAITSEAIKNDPICAHLLDGNTRTWIGNDAHCQVASMDNGKRIAFQFTHREKPGQSSMNFRLKRGVSEEVIPRLKGWDPILVAAISHFPSALNWPVPIRKPAENWISNGGRIAFLGDAIHPMQPTSFQGGSSAIEDGATVAITLAMLGGTPRTVPLALRAFEALRLPFIADDFILGEKQREAWHGYKEEERERGSVGIMAKKAYMQDAELHAIWNFEKVVRGLGASSSGVNGGREFVMDRYLMQKVVDITGVEAGSRVNFKFGAFGKGVREGKPSK